VENAQSTLLNAGGKDQLLADFTALCETTTMDGLPKYAMRPTMETLAKFITAQSGGPNKDMAIFELCHLVCGAHAILGAGGLQDFFLYPDKASPARFRDVLVTSANGVDVEKEHIRIHYGDKFFDIRFGRMPFLCALYEFLCSMDGFTYYAAFNDLFETLNSGPISEKAIRDCSNAIASDLRKYRIANLTTAQADGKFVQVYKFLQDHNDGNGQINLSDQSVLDFWCLHNQGKDYRGYRTVFDLFCDFTKAFEESRLQEASRRASTLGVNVDEGEVEIADNDYDTSALSEWVSPFDTFDDDDFKDVRFFKKKTERGPIESLMAYGPDALRLPLAFLRYEIFGQVQSGITNDLQVGRGMESVLKRVSCDDVQSYDERLSQCEDILGHIKNLQASSLHVLAEEGSNVVNFPSSAQEKAASAFAKMNRKGFDKQATDQRAVFEEAAHALVTMESQLVKYMDGLKTRRIDERFDEDRETFRTQFHTLYEEVIT